ncbi:MAG: IclR family transcriptional regulator C-terminal domain-containing protein, partial [Candidatus Eiseniibacteriota bacterium]
LADPTTRERYLASHPLNRRTRYTITDIDTLRAELAAIAERGYAMDQEEYAEGVCCMAVPISDGAVPFAVGLSAPANRFATEKTRYLSLMGRAVGAAPLVDGR